ncbi:MAG: TcfC E-set like domain-containing protein [Gammaproteobacteria bacterium]|nr:TcfC E-set like domain-containing protein [Gammaproteobacteria bacterium]
MFKFYLNWFVLAFCLTQAFPSSAFAAKKKPFVLETSAPKGFEALTAPQELVADLYYGSRAIGAAHITVDPQYIRFTSPMSVLSLLPETLDESALMFSLKTPQPKNTQYVCRSAGQVNCGHLTPDKFGVIYDEERYRLDIFIAPELLPQQPAIDNPYLPDSSSENEFSIVQNLRGTWSGVENDWGSGSYSATLNGNTIIGFEESALHANWSVASEEGYQLNTLHWTRDYRGKAYSVGLLQPQGGSLLTQEALYGVELRSSLRSRTDINYLQGAPIEVNMPVRGRVEVYRNKRLIHTEMMEAGNHLLNTSTMHSGSYEVEIRTFDETGRALSQYIEFFSKDSQLPPPGEWRWSFQAGLPTRNYSTGTLPEHDNSAGILPEHYNSGLVQGSVARRLTDNLGLFSSVAATEKEQLFKLDARWIGRYMELSPSLMVTNQGRIGYGLQARMKTRFGTLSAMETKFETASTAIQNENYHFLSNGYSQRNLQWQSNIFGGWLSLRYSERNQPQRLPSEEFTFGAAEKLTTLEFGRTIFQSLNWFGEFTISHSEADDERYTSVGIQFRRRTDHWQHSVALRSESNNQGGRAEQLDARVDWYDQDLWAAEVEQHFLVKKETGGNFLESQTQIAGNRGYLNATVGFKRHQAGNSINYLGGFSTNLVGVNDALAWGGEKSLNSAVIIDIEGSEKKDFEILVDGNRRGYAKGGAQSVISLPAFKSYDLSIRPLDDGFFNYRERRKLLTLYPGNVSLEKYQILSQTLAFGQLKKDGKALAGIKVSIGKYNTLTDQSGIFQLLFYPEKNKSLSEYITWGNCRSPVIKANGSAESWLNLGEIEQSKALCQTEDTEKV